MKTSRWNVHNLSLWPTLSHLIFSGVGQQSVRDYVNSMLTPLRTFLSSSYRIWCPTLDILFPSPKVNFHLRCIFSQKFDPTLSQIGRHAVRPHFTKSCSFTLAHFFHLTSEYSSISSLSSSDWAELGGIVRRHVDPKKALQQVQKKITPTFQSLSITFPLFLFYIGDIS